MRVAAIQMNSGADVGANLKLADRLLADAAEDHVRLAVLPENFALMPAQSRDKAAHAEARGQGPIQEFLADAARRYGMWIVAGSMPLRSPEAERVFGACPVFDDHGKEHRLLPEDAPVRREAARSRRGLPGVLVDAAGR